MKTSTLMSYAQGFAGATNEIVDMEKAVISHYFPEMRKRLNECKYNNCLHMNEPKCAIKSAVDSGDLDESRYTTYLQLMEEDPTENYRKNDFA